MPILQSDSDHQIVCDSRYPHMDADCECFACRLRRMIDEAYGKQLDRSQVLRILAGLTDVAGSLLAMMGPLVVPSFNGDLARQIDRHRAYQVGLERLRMEAGEALLPQEIRSLEQACIIVQPANFSSEPIQPSSQIN